VHLRPASGVQRDDGNDSVMSPSFTSAAPAPEPSGGSVFVAVSIDTECDKGPEWKTEFPLRFRSVTEGIPNRLSPLFRKYGIIPTYLISPEILKDPHCVAILRQLLDCELGTHLHGEFIEPEEKPEAVVTSTPQIAYAPHVEREKLKNLTELFESCFGRRPASFRAGRFALSGRTLGFLEELGYRVDSSVTPFRTNEFVGGFRSNFWGAPLVPYHPSLRDPRKSGSLQLLEVPVTILAPALAGWPPFLLRRLSDRAVHRRLLKLMLGGAVQKLWVRPLRGNAEELVSWADTVIRGWGRGSTPVLNVMFHSVEVIPGASPYTQTDEEVAALLEALEHLFAHLHAKYRVVSAGLGELSTRVVS
jgi:hypothetical protein